MSCRSILRFALILISTASLQAQTRGHMGPPSVQPGFGQPIGTPPRGIRSGFNASRSSQRIRNHGLFLGDPYLYDYGDYFSAPGPPPVEPQPAIAPAPQAAVAPPPEPLLLEWHGDRWVKVSPTAESAASAGAPAVRQTSARNAAPTTAVPPPHAVLIFSDGHREEVSRYMIVGKVMYTNSDYWTTGTWTKKVLLSSLDLPASLRANQDRGAKLVLPDGPYEVVIGT